MGRHMGPRVDPIKVGDLVIFRTYMVIPEDLKDQVGLVVEVHHDMPISGLVYVSVITQVGTRRVYLPIGIERIDDE